MKSPISQNSIYKIHDIFLQRNRIYKHSFSTEYKKKNRMPRLLKWCNQFLRAIQIVIKLWWKTMIHNTHDCIIRGSSVSNNTVSKVHICILVMPNGGDNRVTVVKMSGFCSNNITNKSTNLSKKKNISINKHLRLVDLLRNYESLWFVEQSIAKCLKPQSYDGPFRRPSKIAKLYPIPAHFCTKNTYLEIIIAYIETYNSLHLHNWIFQQLQQNLNARHNCTLFGRFAQYDVNQVLGRFGRLQRTYQHIAGQLCRFDHTAFLQLILTFGASRRY